MRNTAPIKTVIIDSNKEFVFNYIDQLSDFCELEVTGWATNHKHALNLIIQEKPELILLDIEMPDKNGFELLTEIRNSVKYTFEVIFHTAFDRYGVQALRNSAFDYLIKPIASSELKNAIERYKKNRNAQRNQLTYVLAENTRGGEIISLPTNIGLRFVDKNNIVLFQCVKESIQDKPYWEALLNDFKRIRLKTNITAKEIIQVMGKDKFIQINQSSIICINYLNIIEFKTNECLLQVPFDSIKLSVSRMQMAELKDSCAFL